MCIVNRVVKIIVFTMLTLLESTLRLIIVYDQEKRAFSMLSCHCHPVTSGTTTYLLMVLSCAERMQSERDLFPKRYILTKI